MFWPDSADRQARGNLRQALKLVRRALEDSGDAIIVSEGDALVLKPGTAEVDVELFERFHETGTHEALEQYRVCRTALERELGVGPEAETEQLYQVIRNQRARVELPASDPNFFPEPVAAPRSQSASRI